MSAHPSSPGSVEEVTARIALVKADPRRELDRAIAHLTDPAGRRVDGRGRFEAHCIAAAAALELDDVEAASCQARAAVRWASRSGRRDLEGLARTLRTRVFLYAGNVARAVSEADRAESLVSGEALGALLTQRVVIQWKLGDLRGAMATLKDAIT